MPRVIIFFFVIVIAGCSNIPFNKIRYMPVDQTNPLEVVHKYKSRLPDNIRLMNTITINYNWKKLSCLSFLNINVTKKTYDIACFSPLGLKLFEVSGNNNSITNSFMLGEFSRKDDLINLIGDDIRRIYFNPVPSPSAIIIEKKDRIIFTDNAGQGIKEYEFAGSDVFLVKKSYYKNSRLQWKISYYEYREKDGVIYPGGIILRNYKYRYNLTLKLKEILN